MIFREAFQSIRDDRARAFFYWLTFVLTSMFVFLFVTVAMSDQVGVTMVNSASDIPTNLMIFSIILCSIEIIFANNFFVKNKGKDLAVRLICGATYVQLAAYLLIQTVFLLIIAIPLGIFIGTMCLPMINQFLSASLGMTFTITVTGEAMLWTALMLGYVVFWTLLLNLSFAYKNSAAELLNPQALKLHMEPFLKLNVHFNHKFKQIASAAVFIAPLLLLYVNHSMAMELSAVSLIGLGMCTKEWLDPVIDKHMHEHISDPETIGSLGFIRNDLKIMKFNIVLFLLSSIMLVSILITAERPMDQILVMITYVVMNALLALAILFKLSSELGSRGEGFRTLRHIGYLVGNEKRIITKEVFAFYGIVILIILIYMVNLCMSLIVDGEMTYISGGILILTAIVPLILCALINTQYYEKSVLSVKETHIN
jgi:hypothetical protein